VTSSTSSVPELAPALGRLIVPRRFAEPWVPLDDLREALATRVIECAGAARRGATAEAPARAFAGLDRGAWSAAWEDAVRRSAERVAGALDAELTRAARRVRMPRKRRGRLALSGAERRAVAARLASGADGFEAALDAVARATEVLHQAGLGDATALHEWREAQQLAARRLEAAWLALEGQVGEERARWDPELAAVLAWRPTIWPVFAVWVPLAAVAFWVALVLGGYLPAPAWLAESLGF